MKIVIKKDYAKLCEYAAKEIAVYVSSNPGSLLCIAAGDTLLGVFARLVLLQKNGEVDLNKAFYIELDEWVGLDYNTEGSCKQVVQDNFYGPAGINPERIKKFDGKAPDMKKECDIASQYIKSRGGIGLSVLGIGQNGHIGFNEPNCDIEEDCIVVPLDKVTKSVSHKYFGRNLPVEYGITVSLKALSRSKKIILLANGEKKAQIVKKTLSDPVGIQVPSTMLREHKNIELVIDKTAATFLSAESGVRGEE